jgi:hypothetical protein
MKALRVRSQSACLWRLRKTLSAPSPAIISNPAGGRGTGAGASGALATRCETNGSHPDASSHLYPMPQTVIIRSFLGSTRRSFVMATVTEE